MSHESVVIRCGGPKRESTMMHLPNSTPPCHGLASSDLWIAGYYDEYIITPTDGRTFAINAPLSPMIGRRITVTIRNRVGTLGAVAWDPRFKLSAWTQPIGGASRSIDFSCDGANWIEVARTPADVPI